MLDKDEAEELESDKSKMSARFEQEMNQRVREWMILAEETLVPQKKLLYFMPGNDDFYSIDAVIDEFEHVHNPDMSMMAEIVVQLVKEIRTEEVDWLAWEDPFILGREANELFRERENSLEETHKRLSYALPMMEVIRKGIL